MRQTGYILILILLFSAHTRIAGNTVVIEDINELYGLPKNRVNCALQDSKGFLWFGMVNGLYKFDLISFTRYDTEVDENELPDADVRALCELKPGILMIGTTKGLFLFNTITENFESAKFRGRSHNLPPVMSILKTANGDLWIGTVGGLYNLKLEEEQGYEFSVHRTFNSSNSNMNANEVLDIIEIPGGEIWFLTTADIATFSISAQNILAYDAFGANTSITYDDNQLFLSSYGDGVRTFDLEGRSFTEYALHPLLVNTRVRCLTKDTEGRYWLSISNMGLLQLDSLNQADNINLITSKDERYDELNSSVIYQIFESGDGTLWLCSEEGINKLVVEPDLFEKFSIESEINPSMTVGIRALLAENERIIWLGTVGYGLFRYDLITRRYTAVPIMHNGSEIGHSVQAIIKDRDGNIWLGTEGEGVIRFTWDDHRKRPDNIINIRMFPVSFPQNTIQNDYIMCLLKDRQDNIWIGTWNGLSLISSGELAKSNPEEIQIMSFRPDSTEENSISNPIIMSLFEDSSGNIWIGTQGGLDKVYIENGDISFKSDFKNESGISLNEMIILDIIEAKDGGLWFSTQDGGISYLDVEKSRFKSFDALTGFHDHIINSISKDSTGILWLGTNNGLCRFDPLGFSFEFFSTEDGLLSNDFFYRSNTFADDQLILGGNRGITYFNPYSVSSTPIEPNLVLTGFRLFNDPVRVNSQGSPLSAHISYTDELRLRYSQNYIGFEFAALNYRHTREIHYSCILEGLENSWNDLNDERRITYTNLSPGEYVFRVKAYVLGQKDYSSEIALPVVITPPFWRTVAAYIFYLILFTLIIYFIYRYFLNEEKKKHALALERVNNKRVHEMDMLKLQFYTNISHELRTPLTLISAPLESLMEGNVPKKKAQDYYQMMHKNVQRLRRLINQLLDMRKIEEGHLVMEWSRGNVVDFVSRVVSTFETYAEKRNIHFSFTTASNELMTFFDADKLEKVLFNLVSNAFKYTPEGGTIKITFSVSDPALSAGNPDEAYYSVAIEDSGFGIPQENIRNIFKPFHQVKKNKPIGSAGSGLGLSLVRELVDLQKGRITVESEVNSGSLFVVQLPVIQELPDELQTGQLREDDTDSRVTDKDMKDTRKADQPETLVLIVEDNQELRKFLIDELRSEYELIEAADGAEGLSKALDTIPDLIVSDLMMDQMDGIELCKQLKTDMRTSHIPVILLTARQSEEVKQNSFLLGADDFITKPFNISLLRVRIRNLIAQRRKLRKLFGTDGSPDSSSWVTNKTDAQFIHKLNDIISKNIDNPEFNPVSLAADMAMSKMQLYRKVSALTNQTVSNYIRTIRMNKAAQLLVSTDMQIAEVAYNVGFSEASNFTKTFSKHFRKTPTQFVREHRK